jgi:hypothetical protein
MRRSRQRAQEKPGRDSRRWPNELKELAKETAKATEDISREIESMQMDTKDSVEAIGTISGIINLIDDIPRPSLRRWKSRTPRPTR